MPGPITDEQLAELIAAEAASTAAHSVAGYPIEDVRLALSGSLKLVDLYQAASPEEKAVISTQVAGALAQYRLLENPPADIVALAASFSTFGGLA